MYLKTLEEGRIAFIIYVVNASSLMMVVLVSGFQT